MHTPITAANTWPKKQLRGWARGDSIDPYRSTAEAPYKEDKQVNKIKNASLGSEMRHMILYPETYKTANNYGNIVDFKCWGLGK